MRVWACVLGALLCPRPVFCQQKEDSLAAARALADSGKIKDSEALLRRFIEQNPSSSDAYFLLGYDYFRDQKPRDSLAAFTEGARFRRPGADSFKVIASDYVLLGDYPDADKWFSVVTSEKPNDVDAWYLLGRTQYAENHFMKAIASFNRAIELRPKYVKAENNLGLAWQGLNHVNRAMDAFRQAIAWQSGHPVDAQPYLNLGISLTDQNQPNEALPWLQEAARLAPQNPKAHEELARALEADHRLPEARRQLQAAVALAPDASELHFKLGRIYQQEGLHGLAQQQFDICQKLFKTHSSVNTPNPYQPE